MRRILFIFIFTGLAWSINAQNVINPVRQLIKATYENKMFSHRLLMDYILIKNNIYQTKVMSDIDNTLARYDENLLYIAQFSQKDNDIHKKMVGLQLFWNEYRMLFIDFEHANLNDLIKRTHVFYRYNNELADLIIKNRHLNDKYPKQLNVLDILADLNNQINQLLINYFLKDIARKPIYKVKIKDIRKNIQKLQKTSVGKQNLGVIEDLYNTLSIIETLYATENNSKQMYSNMKYFIKKNFILMKKVLMSINE